MTAKGCDREMEQRPSVSVATVDADEVDGANDADEVDEADAVDEQGVEERRTNSGPPDLNGGPLDLSGGSLDLNGGPPDLNDDLWAAAPLRLVPPGADAVTIVLPLFKPVGEERAVARSVIVREALVLIAIAAFQAVLAWRLAGLGLGVGANSADQAAMVRAGHEEIAYLLHGRHITRYETVLPGAPVLYPVLVAAFDAVGKAHAVHFINLLFAMLASVGVYWTARRLYGPVAGALAAGLFAGLGPAMHLGVSGTYDTPAICLLAWAACFAVRFAYADGRNAVWLAPLLMLAANWTSYVTVLWDPAIFALIAFAGPGYDAWKNSRSWNAQRAALVAGVLVEITLLVGRAPAYTGIAATVMNRSAPRSGVATVLRYTGQWLGPVLALALLGLVASAWQVSRQGADRNEFAVPATLFVSGLIAPLNQLRWHSLDGAMSHCAIGGAFAAIAAGGFLASVCRAVGLRGGNVWRVATVSALCAALIPLGLLGLKQATTFHSGGSGSKTAALAPAAAATGAAARRA
jgi:hypothetical protein